MLRTVANILVLVVVTQTYIGTHQASPVPESSDFARALLRALGQANTSLVISPYSLFTSLVQIAALAEGNTQYQILSAEGLQAAQLNEILQGIHELNLALREAVLQGQVNYLDPTFTILSGTHLYFLESISQPLAENVTGEVEIYTPQIVQNFVSQLTEGRVHIYVLPESLVANTILVVDAMVVHSQWQDLFHTDETSKHPFLCQTPGGYVESQVDMMTGVRTVLWKRDLLLQLDTLELPLQVPDLVLAIVLPHNCEGLPVLERMLMNNGDLLGNISQGLSQARLRVGIPRFRFETSIHFKDSLEALGVTDAFDPTKADFKGLYGYDLAYISDMVHGAAIDVNEEGISRDSPLELATPPGLAPPTPSLEDHQDLTSVIADHPFLFFIKHNNLSRVLMAGKYLGP